jgi:hypothetical protein
MRKPVEINHDPDDWMCFLIFNALGITEDQSMDLGHSNSTRQKRIKQQLSEIAL